MVIEISLMLTSIKRRKYIFIYFNIKRNTFFFFLLLVSHLVYVYIDDMVQFSRIHEKVMSCNDDITFYILLLHIFLITDI